MKAVSGGDINERALDIEDAQTFLFVPGDRADRFDKAISSGADLVIIDLEDAVAPRAEDAARQCVVDWLASGGRAAVRVNGAETPWFREALIAVHDAAAVVLPKARSAADVGLVTSYGQAPTLIIPLIETARGVTAAIEICESPGVLRVGFGNVDLAAELGVDPGSRLALQAARSQLVYASRAAGIATPIDGVTTRINDDQLVADDTNYGRELGFGGKLTVHPRQVPIVATAFRASEEELAWAVSVLESASDGVTVHDGRIVDLPVLTRARTIVRRARRATGA